MREKQHVLGALTKRRHRQRDDIQAIEEIFAKPSGLDLVLEDAIGRGDETHVGLPLARFAEPLVRPVVEKSQQAGLRIRRQLADFVQEQRATFSFLHLARDIGNRAREGALCDDRRARSSSDRRTAPGN